MIQMNVKGLAFQQFRSQLIYEFDEERWNNYFEILKESNPFFQQGVIATTNIPLEEYKPMIFFFFINLWMGKVIEGKREENKSQIHFTIGVL